MLHWTPFKKREILTFQGLWKINFCTSHKCVSIQNKHKGHQERIMRKKFIPLRMREEKRITRSNEVGQNVKMSRDFQRSKLLWVYSRYTYLYVCILLTVLWMNLSTSNRKRNHICKGKIRMYVCTCMCIGCEKEKWFCSANIIREGCINVTVNIYVWFWTYATLNVNIKTVTSLKKRNRLKIKLKTSNGILFFIFVPICTYVRMGKNISRYKCK